MSKSNLTKNLTIVFTLLSSIAMSANDVRKLIPIRQDDEEGPPPPPGTPIDGYVYVLIVVAIVMVAVFYSKNKVKEVN